MSANHVRLVPAPTGIEVWIDDCELFDYVDDELTNAGLNYEYLRQECSSGRDFYVMVFDHSLHAALERALQAMPRDEIARIWQLNNEVT